MVDLLNPLPPESLGQINAALDQISEVEAGAAKAKRAGIDVVDIEKQAEETRAKLQALKQVYFPNS